MNRKLELPVDILRTHIRPFLFWWGWGRGLGGGGFIYADDFRSGEDVRFIFNH